MHLVRKRNADPIVSLPPARFATAIILPEASPIYSFHSLTGSANSQLALSRGFNNYALAGL